MLLRELLVRPAWQGWRVGKRIVLIKAKAKLAIERELHSVVGMTSQSRAQC